MPLQNMASRPRLESGMNCHDQERSVAEHECEGKLNKLGDALRVMEQHVDFAALAAEVDHAAA